MSATVRVVRVFDEVGGNLSIDFQVDLGHHFTISGNRSRRDDALTMCKIREIDVKTLIGTKKYLKGFVTLTLQVNGDDHSF